MGPETCIQGRAESVFVKMRETKDVCACAYIRMCGSHGHTYMCTMHVTYMIYVAYMIGQ